MATDSDSIPNSQLTYAIVAGDRQNQFEIDHLKGYISVSSSLDREKISAYVLEVECTDSGTPSLSAVGLVNIEVSDVNDNPPNFSQANYTALVQIMENRCTSDKCVYGQCIDHIVLDRTSAYSVTTDVLSYVSPHHYRKLECQCDPGYGGKYNKILLIYGYVLQIILQDAR
ncbi:protocadherin-23-like [Centruroides sculpturatus]|uniref:protocadherin-23-like n=1 Tax=Centruroides sculpturatus TaxID=218467 RepID=UPI000C6D6F9B|nr:protocadherin-23-like [Centruroides sculpturatus]